MSKRVVRHAAILAVVLDPVDGDSVGLRGVKTRREFVARVGGIDTPSNGDRADEAIKLIRTWTGKRVNFQRTSDYTVHGEFPGIVTDAETGENLGRTLMNLGHADRLPQFPIEGLPALMLRL